MFFKGDEYGGSGSFVGPHHVLTCGHNVYSRKFNQWADNITVYPALNGGSAPFGKSTVAKVYTFRGWVTSGNQEFDMALLILDSSIGEHTGWCGLLSTLDDTTLYKQEVHITGYPGDKELNQMWTMCHKISIAGPEQFDYEIDTHPGQSGSPIWIDEWGTPMILGVHTLGGNDKNSGVRLSQQKFTRLLINKISQTYVLNPQVLLIPPVAYGYEQIYQRFLNGRLIYKPNKGNDIGKIELRIADLTNPLEGTFNLSQCGDAGKYLSISTGYRKGMKPENANKVEIWFVPRFLVEREINEGASHFKPIFLDKWPNTALIGISWTWGGGHDNEWYDYLTDQTMDALPTRNLYKNWKKSRTCISSSLARCLRALLAEGQCHSNFHVTFA
jgi:V8-like Glu-specific endopeptidase